LKLWSRTAARRRHAEFVSEVAAAHPNVRLIHNPTDWRVPAATGPSRRAWRISS
jgi:hypothetical protein